MGGILSYFFSWGPSTPNYDTTPDPGTGLSERDRKLIEETWALVTDKRTIKNNSVEFFMQLFKLHPYMQDYFPSFKGKEEDELRKCPKLKAHSLSVMYAIGSFVENLDDPEALVGLVQKMAVAHVNRGLKEDDFDNLAKVFIYYIRALLGAQCTPHIEEAWTKLLAAQTAIMKQTREELC